MNEQVFALLGLNDAPRNVVPDEAAEPFFVLLIEMTRECGNSGSMLAAEMLWRAF